MEPIGEYLKKLRTQLKLSFREAAEKSGLSHSYIRYLEEGKRPGSNSPINPTPETLKKLSEAYNHMYEDLLFRAGYLNGQMFIDAEGHTRTLTDEETSQHISIILREQNERERADIGLILEREPSVYFHGRPLDADEIRRINDMIKLWLQ
ncbi:helix-turn-helix domain-containing protein [Paenibacillus sinopodophylli]|uniref:helix-turn-helix domain-containing protein n=1 Tax=Paenibacillus sinopodophylli TaxID=1837342 RepID=UPI00110CF86F|nr:helix-turn-helix transcriptional regulator [Paenibacillus sinopodophylli]